MLVSPFCWGGLAKLQVRAFRRKSSTTFGTNIVIHHFAAKVNEITEAVFTFLSRGLERFPFGKKGKTIETAPATEAAGAVSFERKN
jgi:hypothetical protein